MVFESLVADLLNKYIGQYVENLDASQLKIGIWGGNVALDHLELKDTALDDLDLPIKVVHGYLEKLTLSIPWKNLYHESTVVEIHDLHVLAKPNFDIKYNEEKEEKAKIEKKKQHILNIEEARIAEEKRKSGKKEKEEEDSFAEKLATNVIKNLQVTIKNIHVRYEDTISDPAAPFSIGFTLENLSAQTTNEKFVPQVIKESVTVIHKLVCMDNLALYWNPEETFKEMQKEEWLNISKSQIACRKGMPTNMKYILQPIVASKKLKINTKPGTNLEIPKIFLSLVLKELGIVLLQSQYHGLVHLLESFERMGKNVPFRKYRPNVALHGSASIWWYYCIDSILEEDVRRRTKMWSWGNIQKHRALCKAYKNKYKEKVTVKSPSKTLLAELEEMEHSLNITSITIFRSLAENEVLREKKLKKETKSSGFFGFFSSSKKKEEKVNTASKIEELMGSDKEVEMKKLYSAIGYSENEVITPFPANYVATVFQFQLQRISITVRKKVLKKPAVDIIRFTLDGITVDLRQRPSAQAIKACVKIGKMKLFGSPNEQETPVMIRNTTEGTETDVLPLVDFVFETNPMDKEGVDQCISAICQPLEIVYDAQSINDAIEFFEPPEDVLLQDLQERAYSTFEDFKVSSTAGLLNAMDKRNILDVNIHVSSSYLIVPEKGVLAGCKDMIVVDFGSFHLQSDPDQIRVVNPKDIHDITEVEEKAYDRFLLKLTDLQILLCREGEDLHSARKKPQSKFHILHPIEFSGNLAKAILPQDPRLKQICVSGELSSLELTVSDEKLSRVVMLLDGLPLPKTANEQMLDDDLPTTFVKAQSFSRIGERQEQLDFSIPVSCMSDSDESLYNTPPDESILSLKASDGPDFESGVANQVMIELNFQIKKVKLSIALTDKEVNTEKECVEVLIENIGTEVRLRRWDMFVNANIGRLLLREMTHEIHGQPIDILSTPKDTNMLHISYRRCQFDESLSLGPAYFYSAEAQIRALQFKDEFQSTEQLIDIQVATLYVMLHQEALLSMMSLVYQVLEPMSKKDIAAVEAIKRHVSSSQLNLAMQEKEAAKKVLDAKVRVAANELKEKVGVYEERKLKLVAHMDGVGVFVCSSGVDLANAFVKGLAANVVMQDEKMEVKAHMTDLQVVNAMGNSKFEKIISMQSDQVFDLEIVLFENGSKGANAIKVSAVDTIVKLDIGQMRAVFLNRFVSDILAFVDHFEDAQKAILEAGKAARDKATAAVTEYSNHSSRHQLNITVHAPMILIPVHSNSDLALLVDLGELHIFNNFKILNKDKHSKDVVITDNIIIKLSDLKVMKSLIKGGKDIKVQKELIKPMTLKMSIVRNLTSDNHTIPDVAVQGLLQTITLILSEEDLNVALKVVQGNIAEGTRETKSNQLKSKGDQLKPGQDILSVPNVNDRLASIHEDPVLDNVLYGKIHFKFELEKIVLQVYLKPSDLTFEEEFLERDVDFLLSQFVIGHLDVTGTILSDDSIDVNVTLDTLILDDMRPTSRDTLTRMVDNCPEPLISLMEKQSDMSQRHMIEVGFKQSTKSDKNIDIKLSNLLCIFNVEFIMVLMRTLMAAMPKEEKEPIKGLSDSGSPTHSIASSEDDTDGSVNDTESTEDQESSPPEMRLQLNVKNPQIVILADAQDAKTNAMFLTTEVNFQYLEVSNIQKMMGTVVNTAMLSTAFKKQHRTDISTVLSLSMLNFHSSAPIGEKPHMHVNTSLVKMNISPKTIQMISACVGQTAAPPDEEMLREAQKALGSLWHLNNIVDKKLWYLNTPAQDVLSSGSFVLARTKDGDYQNGFLAKKDTHFTVYFYPDGSISHSVSDVTAVVVDVSPQASDLTVGCNVVAVYLEQHASRVGRIMEVWSKAGTPVADEVATEAGHTDNDWEPLSKNEESFDKYLIRFYHDNTEKYLPSEEIRLLPKPIKNVIPGLGAYVYARFRDGFYYRGVVKAILGFKIRIHLEEIDDKIDHDMDDPSAVILNMTPRESEIKRYFKVIASKIEGTKGYHPGKIALIQGNPGYRSYTVKFEDGTTNQVPVTKLLLMPKAPYDALPEIGTYVYSRVARDSPLYEKGIIHNKDDRIYVNHLNGNKFSQDPKNVGFVVRNIVPLTTSLRVGQEVIGQLDSDDQKMYMGVIKEVIQGVKLKKYLVEFTDGSKKKLTPGRIRIIPKYGTTDDEPFESETALVRREQLVIEVEGVSLRIEGYLGGQLVPMLRFDSKLNAEICDWTKKLNAKAFTSLQASYYNDTVAEWEPLVEPMVENNRERPWLLNINYATEDDVVQAGDSSTSDVALLQKPMTSLKLQSDDNLEVTLTKSGLSLLQDLGKAFEAAVEQTVDAPKVLVIEKDPFVIHNKTGKAATITVNDLLEGKKGEKAVTLEPSANVGLRLTERNQSIRRSSHSKLPTLSITIAGFMEIRNVAVKRQKTVIYDLISTNILASTTAYSLIVQITATDGQRVITLRSPLQIQNHFPMPLDLSYLNKDNKSVKLISIDAGDVYAVPLVLAYHSSFYVKPAGFGYNDSTEPLSWSDLLEDMQKQYVCTNPIEGTDNFFVQVVVENDVYSSIHGMLESVPKYTLHCYPPITLHNYLPYAVFYRAKGMKNMETLEGGSHWPLFTVNVEEKPIIDIELDYLGVRWHGSIIVSECKKGNSKTAHFTLLSDGDRKMELGMYSLQEGSLCATLYCPYWMLNKTGKSLVYEAGGGNETHEHAETVEDAIMFYVKGKKKKARICVSGCDWSNEFSLDTIGSGGSLKSEGLRGRMYEIGVGISLSYFGLTKVVTFTPLRIISNHTKYTISMAEGNSETAEWHTVKPEKSVPYWPTRLPPEKLHLNVNGCDSVNFNLEAGKTLLLRFSNEIGGICVNYQEKDSTSLLSFSDYFAGAAPVRIENLCKKISMISYKQADYFKGHVLLYGQSVLYTWDDPMEPHELVCAIIEVDESHTKIKLSTNDFGRMKTGDAAIYWVSFLDGLQRVLLFTDNFKAAYCACQEQTLRPTQEVNLNIEGFGLSLVNAEKRMEIAYLSVKKSPIVWEQHKKNRWKTLSGRMCEALEEGYISMQTRKSTSSSKDKILDIEVDFDKMFITKPEKIQIRRTFHSGVGFQYIISPNRMQIRATISSLQLDSHIPGSTFLTIIHQVEPPRSITNENDPSSLYFSAPKPFFELSLTTNVGRKNEVNEISYLKVLAQELDIRIDKGFLLALMDLFNHEKIRGTESEQYKYDMSIVRKKLEESPEFQSAKQDKRYVFNYFHLSPLKIHVSFSMTGGHSIEGNDSQTSSSIHGNVLGLLLQSIGVAFTEIQDVEFKLACYEIDSLLLSNSQLTDSIAKHYQNQAIKQLYVLVLGLDVLGNPYGLITGVGTGAKNFFYEPYQGLIQGPEEFAEGLAYGVKSLVGGTVGGVSGAVSKITGTVGKGLAALTMDDEYQQKRRQAMSQRPTNIGQGLAEGGKGLVKGVVSGVTGVVTKPIEGAKSGGVGGFFKGIGKGLIGVVARPAGGVVDMASSTFEGLKGTTSGAKTTHQLRVARVFHADKVLRPFNEYEADGNKVLIEADKGLYAKTDFYLAHVYPVDVKNYLILSNQNILYMTRNEILRDWTCDWKVSFKQIKGLPEVEGSRIVINLHSTETRKSIFKKTHNSRTIALPAEETAKWFLSKFEDAKML